MNISQLKTCWDNLNSEITSCRECPRLVEWREEVARVKKKAYQDWIYWGKPVPGFGDLRANILVVGLAPGAHGANRTGRMFTGDSSGDFLFGSLHRTGFANQPISVSVDDGLQLKDIFISASARCVPPDNKPTPTEIRNCRPYLEREIELLSDLKVIVALGQVAFKNVLTTYQQPSSRFDFSHGAVHQIGKLHLIASYHPSQQNTQTGKLTQEMFDQIWVTAKKLTMETK